MTYCTTNNEDSLLLPLHPLNDLVGALRQSISTSIRTCHAVELEHRRDPSQRGARARDTVVDFEMGVFGMNTCVKDMVDGQEPTISQCTLF